MQVKEKKGHSSFICLRDQDFGWARASKKCQVMCRCLSFPNFDTILCCLFSPPLVFPSNPFPFLTLRPSRFYGLIFKQQYTLPPYPDFRFSICSVFGLSIWKLETHHHLSFSSCLPPKHQVDTSTPTLQSTYKN